MTAYNWKISQLSHQAADGFVVKVHFDVTATDGEHSASVHDVVIYDQATSALKIQETPGARLIPYGELTEELVIGWVKETLTEYGVNSIESSLAQMIEAKKNPKVINGLPW